MRLVLAATKALNSTATALTDVASYLRMIATDLPELCRTARQDLT